MSRLITITIDLDDLPTAISQSIAAVLESHSFGVIRQGDTQHALDDSRLAILLAELGRNVSQVVLCSEVEP